MSELQGAEQHLESEKLLLCDTLQGELQERMQRLEEDRQSLGISSEWWDDKLPTRGSSRTWGLPAAQQEEEGSPRFWPLPHVHAAGDRHPGGLDGFQKG
ncbi:Breast cancer metastasis-suppressor 1 like protein [Myotis davidii]|uniref:Breast cancer metastasis-suppressor 1 like protein n=1 Tax=Myotis davidii TaxID=225400 RepID=L5LU77_MYODS|nr:Breast cancer metastasis-suppressor 1 like protein [Myotis davidii]